MLEWLLLIGGSIALGYMFYQVWFRPAEYQQGLAELYTEESRTARAWATSRFTLWLARLVVTSMLLVFLYILFRGTYGQIVIR